jgi:hypothetical protein
VGSSTWDVEVEAEAKAEAEVTRQAGGQDRYTLISTGLAPRCKPARDTGHISIENDPGFPGTKMLARELSDNVINFWLKSTQVVRSSKDVLEKLGYFHKSKAEPGNLNLLRSSFYSC